MRGLLEPEPGVRPVPLERRPLPDRASQILPLAGTGHSEIEVNTSVEAEDAIPAGRVRTADFVVTRPVDFLMVAAFPTEEADSPMAVMGEAVAVLAAGAAEVVDTDKKRSTNVYEYCNKLRLVPQ